MKERFAPTVIKKLVFPERTIRGNVQYEHPEDAALVSKLSSGKIRFFTALIPETQHLSQSERVGFLYFNSLVFNMDNAIDNNRHIKGQSDAAGLNAILLDERVENTDITVETLKELTLNRFPPAKKEIIENFWTDMVAYHADLAGRVGAQNAGEYSYDDVIAYRQATNDKLVEVLCALRDITSPEAITREKQRVFLIQLLDDANDWRDDITDASYNLFVGLAAQHYPQEFNAMMEYSTEKSSLSRKKFMKHHMPQTYNDYTEIFNQAVSNVTRKSTRLAYKAAGKIAF